ncbi:conjugal transfer protein [Leucobacter triazinivorans]|uniref:Conjugal transfer protein n=2 Tax=Leucobacter triazinivorans TaxID=1784719 RepID=A0A4V0Z202_9MICO|nr:conjugal transfer protein [Leucobacter triazinivorans]
MSAGDGYKYLLKSVVYGDGDRAMSTPLTRYYSEEGSPPGRWLGSGLAGLADGLIAAGDQVTETQLQLLVGMGRNPITGEALGRPYSQFQTLDQRVAARVRKLDRSLTPTALAEAVALIEGEEAGKKPRKAVAAYDFTFSIPKSASVLWAVADAGTQQLIWEAHQAAVAEMLKFMEREVAATRGGALGPDGATVQLDVAGLVATAYDHYDSRLHDPYLHTHVVVSNKVQEAQTGRWLALDGRPLHAATVALSELHEAVFADTLTRLLGVDWEMRDQGAGRNASWAITGVPEELIKEFSNRARHIELEKERLIAEYVERHGRRPKPATVIKMLQEATLSTRPEKDVRSLDDLTTEWRNRATGLLGEDATAWATRVAWQHAPVAGRSTTVLRADDIPLDLIREIAATVIETIGEKRSTWRRWNLVAEAARQSMWLRLASTQDREAIVGMIADAAEQQSLRLTPPELALTPAQFLREDGSTRFRPKHSTLYSSTELLAAEDRLLARSRHMAGPRLALATIERIAAQPDAGGRMLGPDQFDALTRIAVSGRTLDVLVGPAGTGKTTALGTLRRAWEWKHGEGSVVGLAPSSVAADVLAADLSISTENTAKWREVFERTGQGFTKNQLVILDEASLAGTHSLDFLTRQAELAGAKVLLVGDAWQLQSVDVGGAFSLLVGDRAAEAPELTEVWRFAADWEKLASLELRHGRPKVIDSYAQHGRLRGGTTEEMAEAAYRAWWADRRAGRGTILIAATTENVTDLNERARRDLIAVGYVDAEREVALADGTRASVGDTIITRKNDRRLRSAHSWVRNGERWIVTNVRDDGAVFVRPPTMRHGGGIMLPASYVAENVELGYAVTAHRAQGVTVDTAHTLVEATTTREVLYVSMTRGRYSNIAYVATDKLDPAHTVDLPGTDPDVTARTVLEGVLRHVGAELSAHETISAEQERWGGIWQLSAEYESIAAAAQQDRWARLLAASGLTDAQAAEAVGAETFGALAVELRRAEADGHQLDRLMPRLIAARGFSDADDIASVLHYRLERAVAGLGARTGQRPRLIVGLIPEASGVTDAEMRAALDERRDLIEARAAALLDTALADPASWAAGVGAPPTQLGAASDWRNHLITVAAYRDRHGIDAPDPLGAKPEQVSQKIDHERAAAALTRARQVAARAPQPGSSRPAPARERRGPIR